MSLARNLESGQLVAIKTLSKVAVIRENQVGTRVVSRVGLLCKVEPRGQRVPVAVVNLYGGLSRFLAPALNFGVVPNSARQA